MQAVVGRIRLFPARASLSRRATNGYNIAVPAAHLLTSNLLRASSRGYARACVETLQRSRPSLLAGGLPATFATPEDDLEVRLRQVAATMLVDQPALLRRELEWYRVAFHHRGVPADYLPSTLRAIEATMEREMPREASVALRQHLAAASAGIEDAPLELPTLLDKHAPLGEVAIRFLLANLEGRGEHALGLIAEARAQGASIEQVHDHVLLATQAEAGRMWLMEEIGVRDEHYGSEIVERALSMLQQAVPTPAADAPQVMLFGVAGNLHDLGQRVVAQRLQLAGLRVHNIGANLPIDEIGLALREHDCDLIAISAVMTLHLPALVEQVAALRDAMAEAFGDARARPVVVGGPPFRTVPDLHVAIGADAGVGDAASAVAAAQRLLRTY